MQRLGIAVDTSLSSLCVRQSLLKCFWVPRPTIRWAPTKGWRQTSGRLADASDHGLHVHLSKRWDGLGNRTGPARANSPKRAAPLAVEEATAMAKRAFISFDYDHDEGTKIMLAGQARLPDSPFEFKDASVKEHLPGDWKEKVRRRMDSVDIVIVLCGQKTHLATGVGAELTIAREKRIPYFLLAAYQDKVCTKPSTAAPDDKVYKWTWDNLKALIGGAR
jgi:hypothetical protein